MYGKKHGSDMGGFALELVDTLRRFEEQVPFRSILASIGAALLGLGVLWGSARFVFNHPYFILVSVGLACLLAAALSSRNGLISFLPEGVKDLLLRKTCFDLLHDDVSFQNFLRRWGRMQLLALQSGQSEGDISAIVKDMDPELVNRVLRRTILEWLPVSLQVLLLPPPRLLRRMNQERNVRITEAPLGPAFVSSLALAPKVQSLGYWLWFGALEAVSVLAAVGWATAAGMLHMGATQTAFARLFDIRDDDRSRSNRSLSRLAGAASVFSLLSAGVGVLVALHGRRTRMTQRHPPRPFEPEHEVSPDDSEATATPRDST